MWRVRELLLRLLNALWPGRAERQLSREVDAHLALLEERFVREGLSPAAARAAARREFGGVEQAKEVQRDARSLLWLADTRRDAGYAFRTLRRTPGFTAVAIATLGLGIGAATVIYSVLRNVVLDPFPYVHSDRMVDVIVRDASNNILRGALPPGEFLDYQEQSRVFEIVAGANGNRMHYVSDAGAERVAVVLVTPNTFDYLGVPPLLGRVFGPADAVPGAPAVAVLNHRTWMRAFGGDPNMVGRSITLDGVPRTVIGIMPPRFEWHVGDFWIPSPLTRAMPPGDGSGRWFQARLRPGVSIEEAEEEMNVIARRRAAAFPHEYPEKSRVQVITIIDWVVGRFRQTLYTLFAAVGLLLLIACCNVANMLLSRATTRERELTIRAALGASRQRIVRQLLMESVLLALGGAVLGVALAYGGIAALARIMPRAGVAWEVELRLESTALWFALASAAASTVIFGVLPAFQAARRDLIARINSTGRSGTAAPAQKRLRNGLIVAEVALSVILLLGAGVLMKTFVALAGVDMGFDPRNILLANVAFAPGQAQSAGERRQLHADMIERVGRVRGVQSATFSTSGPPFSGHGSAVEAAGVIVPSPARSAIYFVTDSYARTIGLRRTAGRDMSPTDVAAGRKVAVVNQAFVRQLLAHRDPLGVTIRLPRLATLPSPIVDPTFEIIGVVHDVANQGFTDPPGPHVYVPLTVGDFRSVNLIARTAFEPMAVLERIRRDVQGLDARIAVSGGISMEAQLQQSFLARPRFNLVVLGIFAGVGLILVALGIYGVMAYTVSQDTRQIAIRMALGGERRHVMMTILRTGFVLLVSGLVAGVAAGLMTNRLLESVLWGVTPQDPATIGGAVAVVVLIGMCACCIPAWRAMRVDPVVALRQE